MHAVRITAINGCDPGSPRNDKAGLELLEIHKRRTQFFIAICNNPNFHSFLLLGTYAENRVDHILCRVGKQLPLSESSFGLLGNLWSGNSMLRDEKVLRRRRRPQDIYYQAYQINYFQYIEFIALLEKLQTAANTFKCYKPVSELGENVTLELTCRQINGITTCPEELAISANQLTITNTCRDTALNLARQIEAPVSPVVSRNFLRSLPCKTTLEFGKPIASIPFYVIPPPPNTYVDLTGVQRMIAQRLYHRMENLLVLESQSELSHLKFTQLNELYAQINGPLRQVPLTDLARSITTFKERNQKDLGTLRKTYLWDGFFTRQSATLKMIRSIEHDLQDNSLT